MMSPDIAIGEARVPLGQAIGAAGSDAFEDSATQQLIGIHDLTRAKGGNEIAQPVSDPMGAPIPTYEEEPRQQPNADHIDMIDALDQVKKAGLDKTLKLPNEPDIAPAALAIMIDRARTRAEHAATIARGPQGLVPDAMMLGTSFLVGAVDPLNIASAFVPVIGELRYGKLLAGAGESAAARAGIRAGVGAAQGVTGQALLEPIDWYAHSQDGRDFGMSDVLHNLIFGGLLGAGLHAGGGALSDAWRAHKGRDLYPYGPGEPLDRTAAQGAAAPESGAPITPDMDAVDRVLAGQSAAPLREVAPEFAVLDDLPPRAQEDAVRASIASLLDGTPVRSAELLDAAAQTDPRIAESFALFHGSPHDFERFDNTKIGSGEGAQAFAYGHYLAESEAVAAEYADRLGINRSPSNADLIAGNYELGRAGNLYKVNLKPERQRFLQWETDLTEQPAGRAILEKMDPVLKEQLEEELESHGQPALDQLTGGMLHRLLERYASEGELPGVKGDGGHPKREASEYLASLDVPGVSFLDQKSRSPQAFGDLDALPANEKPTRNFVVFDDKDIDIVGKNGEPFNREQFLAERLAEKEREERLRLDAADAAAATTKDVKTSGPRGRAAADPQTWSLYEYLASKGGMKPDPELEAIFGGKRGPMIGGFGPLLRRDGMALDEALRVAKEGHYLFDAADVTGAEARLTPRDLLDSLDRESRGQKVYRNDHVVSDREIPPEEEARHIVAALHDELEAGGGPKGVEIDPKLETRVVEIVQKEGGTDVLAAYERAIMEDAERYEGLAESRRQTEATRHLPGWDVAEPAAAPRAGAADIGGGGQARLSAAGAGAADGGEPRAAGAGDRAPGAPQLGSPRLAPGLRPQAPPSPEAWHALARAVPEYDAPDAVHASQAAAAAPEPLPVNATASERTKAALAADQTSAELYEAKAAFLAPEERLRIDDALRQINLEEADRREIFARGAVCLAEAAGVVG